MKRQRFRGRWRAVAVVVALGTTALGPVTPAVAVHGAVPGDFNGDGYRDAVLPAPGTNVAGKDGAGAVVVLYGSKSGLSASRRQTITQNSAGVPDSAEAGDGFGAATATADINRDGFADLVVAAPYEDTSKGNDSGAVVALWGSKNGLTSATDLPNPARPHDGAREYGRDVAVFAGGPGAKTQVAVAGTDGSVYFTGPFSRTGTYGSREYNRNTPSVASVALGDFNHDGAPDPVAITVRLAGLSGGEVYRGPGMIYNAYMTQGNGLIAATGDINGDSYADLVVGDPDEPAKDGVDGARGGRVLVWYGAKQGIPFDAKAVQLTQNTAGVPGTSDKSDNFGGALAVADLNRDGLADIVVGTPYEGRSHAGQVTIVPGRRSGALGAGAYSFTQDTADVPDTSESDDAFGATVAVGDVNGDGRPELFVSAAFENMGPGAVWVFPGTTTGPTARGCHEFTPSSVGLSDRSPSYLGGAGLLWMI
ncbi:FG-GAP repeat protein [Streptomyces sp. NPDC005122]